MAKHVFAAAGTYPYRSNIISDDDFEPSGITRKEKMPDENWEGTEDGHSDVDYPLRVDGPDLPRPAYRRIPDNIATIRKCCPHWHGNKTRSLDTQHHKIHDSADGTTHRILESKTEAQQFPPTTFKHLMMTNVGRNM
jgi:hypothetical protein